MNRKLALILALTLLTGILGAAFNAQRAKASGTIYIRADGSIDPPDAPIYTTDNITYTLTGNITADADGIVVERDSIVVDGASYTVQGTGAYDSKGIELSGRSNVTIRSMEVRTFDYGILLDSSSNNTASGNNITNNYVGIMLLVSSNNNSISGNTITGNQGYGIMLDWSCNNNCMSENNITNNLGGITLSSSSNNSISGNNITANNHIGIALSSSSNNNMSGNKVSNSGVGFQLSSSSNNSISGNVFVGCGLHVPDSYGNVVVDNWVNGKPLVYLENVSDFKVEDAGQVILVNCVNMTVKGSDLSNADIGIQLWKTNNTEISGNNITNNVFGIMLYFSSNNSISGNNVTANKYIGIWLSCESNNNSFSGNNVTNNDYGIGLDSSSNNTIYHNNFIDNAQQVYFDSGYANVWDDGYPSCGNYWSDYNGTDLQSGLYQNDTSCDGIGDTPYTIDPWVYDHYPLMGMFSDFDATSDQHVTTICNSTISGCQFNGTAIMFDVTGVEGTAGFCRICVPTSLMNATFRVFVNGTEVIGNLLPCSNSTYNYLYFNYTHSTEEVIIIPEFPSFLILSLFMMAALLAVIVYKRKGAHAK